MTLAVTRPLHDVLETQECSAWFANVGSRTVVQQDCWHCFHLLPTCKLLAGLSIRSHWPMLTYASNLPERKGSVGVQCDGMQWMHWMQVQHGAAVLFSFFFLEWCLCFMILHSCAFAAFCFDLPLQAKLENLVLCRHVQRIYRTSCQVVVHSSCTALSFLLFVVLKPLAL